MGRLLFINYNNVQSFFHLGLNYTIIIKILINYFHGK